MGGHFAGEVAGPARRISRTTRPTITVSDMSWEGHTPVGADVPSVLGAV